MQNWKKPLKIGAWIASLIIFFVIIDASIIIAIGNTHPDCASADAIIVLGSGHGNAAIERANKGLALYEAGKSPTILFSGGKTDSSTSEAEFMSMVVKKELGSSTLSSSSTPHILLENTSKNTHENLENSRVQLPDATSIIIVTDTFHIARSVWSAKMVGFKHVCWGSPDPSYIPSSTLTEDYAREIVALPSYMLESLLKALRF